MNRQHYFHLADAYPWEPTLAVSNFSRGLTLILFDEATSIIARASCRTCRSILSIARLYPRQ